MSLRLVRLYREHSSCFMICFGLTIRIEAKLVLIIIIIILQYVNYSVQDLSLTPVNIQYNRYFSSFLLPAVGDI